MGRKTNKSACVHLVYRLKQSHHPLINIVEDNNHSKPTSAWGVKAIKVRVCILFTDGNNHTILYKI